MAANVSVSNTFTNGTAADAPEVNANFSSLVTWINTNAVHLDGSKAFTAVPSGPAANPTSDNQLARKKYVDDSIAAINLSVGGDLSGTTANAQIVAGAVGATELATDAVTTVKIANDAVTSAKIAANAVDTSELANSAVTNAKVANAAFTNIKYTGPEQYIGRVTALGAQPVASSSSWQAVTLGFENYDPSGMHSTLSNTQRVTVSADGYYHFSAYVRFESTGSPAVLGNRGLRLVQFTSGGSAVATVAVDQRYVGNTTSDHAICISGSVYMTAGQYVDLQVRQNSGSTLDLLFDGDGISTLSWHCLRLD